MTVEVQRILVIGAGAMGRQIGAVFALAGYDTTVGDVSQDIVDAARDEIRTRIARLAEKGQVDDPQAALSRLTWTSDWDDAAREADLVVEAATERLELKRQIFARVSELARPDAILGTNSSTIPSSLLADSIRNPERLCNMHFFNPALVMACVEIVPNPQTSQETIDTVVSVSQRTGKEVVLLKREIPGFIANRLMQAVLDEAMRLHASDVATIEDIDAAARLALGHPMGPFQLMDLVGNDVISFIHHAEFELTGDESAKPSPELEALVAEGRLGRKAGRGWYDYSS
ncbi:3-hydroxyacyl-CoA dehydrogenase family protein [Microbacterium stercoris]|uniref:3-hydroxyacyl-CoA dehydrogenase family protein n=1 Tax=Microbacterium stercoris TaxID=2820289 RepID=A0A939TSH4_9MICO|nr:3-hydroxyacyl-CoA dehydrogenase family protein [Microbacterium stercoris]MBO3661904.1 3-hydroxyacyl-CoA dehydrogenase family protein [Microbacterium stercoris]